MKKREKSKLRKETTAEVQKQKGNRAKKRDYEKLFDGIKKRLMRCRS